MTDKYKCPSYYNDSNELVDCECGECEGGEMKMKLESKSRATVDLDFKKTSGTALLTITSSGDLIISKLKLDELKNNNIDLVALMLKLSQ